jgi:hypothetical protein
MSLCFSRLDAGKHRLLPPAYTPPRPRRLARWLLQAPPRGAGEVTGGRRGSARVLKTRGTARRVCAGRVGLLPTALSPDSGLPLAAGAHCGLSPRAPLARTAPLLFRHPQSTACPDTLRLPVAEFLLGGAGLPSSPVMELLRPCFGPKSIPHEGQNRWGAPSNHWCDRNGVAFCHCSL